MLTSPHCSKVLRNQLKRSILKQTGLERSLRSASLSLGEARLESYRPKPGQDVNVVTATSYAPVQN